MKVTACILMYSGMSNPEMDVSPEIAQEIIDKMYLADKKSKKEAKQKLGFCGYLVIWWGEHGVPYTRIHVYDGIISTGSFLFQSSMKDTIGLEVYLKDLLDPTLEAHYNECLKQRTDFYEEMLRTPE